MLIVTAVAVGLSDLRAAGLALADPAAPARSRPVPHGTSHDGHRIHGALPAARRASAKCCAPYLLARRENLHARLDVRDGHRRAPARHGDACCCSSPLRCRSAASRSARTVKVAGLVVGAVFGVVLVLLFVLAGHPERLGRWAGRLTRRLPQRLSDALAHFVAHLRGGPEGHAQPGPSGGGDGLVPAGLDVDRARHLAHVAGVRFDVFRSSGRSLWWGIWPWACRCRPRAAPAASTTLSAGGDAVLRRQSSRRGGGGRSCCTLVSFVPVTIVGPDLHVAGWPDARRPARTCEPRRRRPSAPGRRTTMKCPYCGHLGDKVVDSRESKEGEVIRRRRECLECGRRFTSYERIDEIPYMVVKKDGRRERFERQKLVAGLLKACEKRPVRVARARSDRRQGRGRAAGEAGARDQRPRTSAPT